MSRKSIGSIVGAIGVIILITAAFADQMGIGQSDAFGWKQITGVVIGALVIGWGVLIAMRGNRDL